MASMSNAPRYAAALSAGLAACQSVSDGSPAGVPIAVEIIDGPPAPVRTALAGELATAASARQVEIVGSGAPARYRVRGYLSTETSADGKTTLAFVWDVFDGDKHRAKRLTGSARSRPPPATLEGPRQGSPRPPRRPEHGRDRRLPEQVEDADGDAGVAAAPSGRRCRE